MGLKVIHGFNSTSGTRPSSWEGEEGEEGEEEEWKTGRAVGGRELFKTAPLHRIFGTARGEGGRGREGWRGRGGETERDEEGGREREMKSEDRRERKRGEAEREEEGEVVCLLSASHVSKPFLKNE